MIVVRATEASAAWISAHEMSSSSVIERYLSTWNKMYFDEKNKHIPVMSDAHKSKIFKLMRGL